MRAVTVSSLYNYCRSMSAGSPIDQGYGCVTQGSRNRRKGDEEGTQRDEQCRAHRKHCGWLRVLRSVSAVSKCCGKW